MAIITNDLSVTQTTEWIAVTDKFNPQTLSIHVIVPAGVVANFTFQATLKRDIDTITDDEIITFTDIENLTESVAFPLSGSFSYVRLVVNSIVGGALKLMIGQSGPIRITNDSVD
jgi:hypothetical protein